MVNKCLPPLFQRERYFVILLFLVIKFDGAKIIIISETKKKT